MTRCQGPGGAHIDAVVVVYAGNPRDHDEGARQKRVEDEDGCDESVSMAEKKARQSDHA